LPFSPLLKHHFPEISHQSSTRQRRRWLNLAAIMAQFPAATDTQSSARLAALLQANSTSPSEHVLRHEQLLQVSAALARLPDDQRLVLEMHYLQGCPVAVIAEEMGRTERSVAGLVRRGLQALRVMLADERD
jgi:RNA polymerase sigma factor (sigma-70 family)